MIISGIGIDIIEVRRVEKAVKQRGESFVNKVFTAREQEYAGNKKFRYMHLAGRFAAKEAIKKALPDGKEIGFNWHEIEILNSEDGKPYVVMHGRAGKIMKKFNLSRVLISISHTEELATANAMVVADG
jgi:holo-[acyl-carrier protein] synthase